MFDDEGVVMLTEAEYDAYVIAHLGTEYGEEMPDPADFVRDEHQRFLDSRIRLLKTGAAHLDAAVAAGRTVARAEASRARSLAAFARSRPAATFDRVPGERGAASAASIAARPAALTDVSEWAVDEAAATLGISGRAASMQLIDAVTWSRACLAPWPRSMRVTSPRRTRGSWSRSRARCPTPRSAGRWRPRCCPGAVGQTAPALRASVRRAVARIDAAAAADRLARAVRDRHVRLDARDDGMSTLAALLTTPVGRACREALSAYAKACQFDEDGNRDPRTHDQRMADCLADLILRPHTDHAAVRVVLTLVAGVDTVTRQGDGADEPGELEGDLVSAAQVRELAYQFGLLPRPHAPADDADEPGSRVDIDADARHPPTTPAPTPTRGRCSGPARGAAGRRAAAAQDLRPRAPRPAATTSGGAGTGTGRRTGSAHPAARHPAADRFRPGRAASNRRRRPAVRHASGTDGQHRVEGGRRSGARPRAPDGTDAYTDRPLYRFVRLRDRRCRFPGCRIRARCCDLDQQVPHPHGDTAHDNLACLCEHHHRLSHQARAGGCTATPTAGWSGRCPVDAPSRRTRRPSAARRRHPHPDAHATNRLAEVRRRTRRHQEQHTEAAVP